MVTSGTKQWQAPKWQPSGSSGAGGGNPAAEVIYIYILGVAPKPWQLSGSSAQVRRGLYTHYRDSLFKVGGLPSPI